MHGLEKSDSFIVAVKPANNSGRSEAESVERREGTKGKVKHGTHRTLSRGSVLCRQIPKVGARCVNRARPDLCGGHPVTGVPTAITPQDHTLRACSKYHRSPCVSPCVFFILPSIHGNAPWIRASPRYITRGSACFTECLRVKPRRRSLATAKPQGAVSSIKASDSLPQLVLSGRFQRAQAVARAQYRSSQLSNGLSLGCSSRPEGTGINDC